MAVASPNPWVAVDPASDRLASARRLQRLHERFQSGGDVGKDVRAIVARSWERSGAAGVDPTRHLAPIVMDERELEDRWRLHPLYAVLPALRQLLSDATKHSGHMLVISDAQGVLLWIEGHTRVVEATENIHLVCGADWSESGAGTNAMGTAIAIDHPVQIFSAEHFNRTVHPWQCSGAPIHDPETGEVIGVVDLTGHLMTAHPHTLSLVTAAASMAEAFLREQTRLRDERLRETYLQRIAGKAQPSALVGPGGRVIMAVPHDWAPPALDVPREGGVVALPDGRSAIADPIPGGGFVLHGRTREASRTPSALHLELLGRRPVAQLNGTRLELSTRHAEILAVLLLSPRGLTAEQLTLELYGERGKPVTVRAELSRLRRLLGGVLQARPYRLAGEVTADFLAVRRRLESDGPIAALEHYPEPLLAESDVPLVAETREALDGELRHAVMASGDPDLVARWCRTGSGTADQPAAELLVSLLGPHDPRRAGALARVERLRTTSG